MAKTQLNILIVGGGIAGPAAAFWLARAGHRVTIVERWPVLRATGTQVDVRSLGVEVVKRMGLMDAIRKRTVSEAGVAMVDRENKHTFFAGAESADSEHQSFTKEIEIMRGDLVRILHDETKDSVSYIFGKTVESWTQDDDAVHATLSDGTTTSYDLLVGADGLGSRIRRSILPPGSDDRDAFVSQGVHMAYWHIPHSKTDSNIARIFNAPGARLAMIRRTDDESVQAYFGLRSNDPRLKSLYKAPEDKQKELYASFFKDAGWETGRMIDGMKATENWYCSEVAQIKSPIWSKGRVVVIADAAHCPAVLTGMGSTSAFVGSYVLAGEVAENPTDLRAALTSYEKKLRPFADEIQWLPPLGRRLLLPQTSLGIRVMHFLMNLGKWLGTPFFINWILPDVGVTWKLPHYKALD